MSWSTLEIAFLLDLLAQLSPVHLRLIQMFEMTRDALLTRVDLENRLGVTLKLRR